MLQSGIRAVEPSGFLHQMEARPTDGIRVESEFPDVFPDDLPGMLPERDIEFSIDLLPGTAPIAKRPYRMAPIEHEEVKKTIDELLTKGYILSTLSCLEFPRSCLLRRRIIRRGYNIQGIPDKDVTDEDVGSCKGVGVVTPRF